MVEAFQTLATILKVNTKFNVTILPFVEIPNTGPPVFQGSITD